MNADKYKKLEEVGKITIIKGEKNFVANTNFIKGVVVDAKTIPELLRELATSIEVMTKFNLNKQ